MESATEPRGLPAVHRPARELDRREREILAFEGQWWKYAGAKEQAVRELFDMSRHAVLPGAQRTDRQARGAGRRAAAHQAAAPAAGQPAAHPLGPSPRRRAVVTIRPPWPAPAGR